MTTKPPWGLSPREAEAVQAVVDLGCHKLAARRMGLTIGTVNAYMASALHKSGRGYRLLMLIAFDRLTRGTP